MATETPRAGRGSASSIDTDAHWTKSGWHGWIYGWKLHLISAVANVWLLLAAELTAANVPDSEPAPVLLNELRALCAQDGRILVTTKYGRYPHHTDEGVEVWRAFH